VKKKIQLISFRTNWYHKIDNFRKKKKTLKPFLFIKFYSAPLKHLLCKALNQKTIFRIQVFSFYKKNHTHSAIIFSICYHLNLFHVKKKKLSYYNFYFEFYIYIFSIKSVSSLPNIIPNMCVQISVFYSKQLML